MNHIGHRGAGVVVFVYVEQMHVACCSWWLSVNLQIYATHCWNTCRRVKQQHCSATYIFPLQYVGMCPRVQLCQHCTVIIPSADQT